MTKQNGKKVHKKFYEFAYNFLVAHTDEMGYITMGMINFMLGDEL